MAARTRTKHRGARPTALKRVSGVHGEAYISPGNPLFALSSVSFLKEGTRTKLMEFCAAHHGADPELVIDKAINKFMADDMMANEGVRVEYGWDSPKKA